VKGLIAVIFFFLFDRWTGPNALDMGPFTAGQGYDTDPSTAGQSSGSGRDVQRVIWLYFWEGQGGCLQGCSCLGHEDGGGSQFVTLYRDQSQSNSRRGDLQPQELMLSRSGIGHGETHHHRDPKVQS